MTSNGWFLELLDHERATFDKDAYPLPKHQMDAFELCCDLLNEEETSVVKRSKQRRSSRSRVRTLLSDIFLGVGPEVFLLCTLSTTISKLANIPLKGLVPKLRGWWKTVSHPIGLTETARELCEASSISSLVAPNRKRQHSDVTINHNSSQSEHALLPERSLVERSATDQPLDQDLSQADHSTIPAPLIDQPLESVLDLKITDLLSFLQQYQASCPDLQMVCPLFGVPLPSIDVKLDSSIGLSAKIEFSLRSSKALMQYVLASRTAAAKVPH